MTITESPRFTHRVETAIHELSERARNTPKQYRRLFTSRQSNILLRDLGQLHYGAYLGDVEPDPDTRQRLLDALDETHADQDDAFTDQPR